jgi:hypothetical protein
VRGRCLLVSAASMAYRVEISRRAEADLEQLYLWVVERAPQEGADGSTDSNAPFNHSTIIRSAVLSRPRTWTPITPSE